MNGLYEIMLFLFVLGAATQGFNEFGMMDYAVPDTGVEPISETGVTEIQEGVQSTGASDYSTIEILLMFLRVIGMGIVAVFTVGPLIIQWGTALGAPAGIVIIMAGIISAPLTVVILFGMWEWYTGRSA